MTPVEYARYSRHEPDGTDSFISASSTPCASCSPRTEIKIMEGAYERSYPKASVEAFSVKVCDQDGALLVAIGIAQAESKMSNVEIYLFRKNSFLYSLAYAFHQAAPEHDAEEALMTLCPP